MPSVPPSYPRRMAEMCDCQMCRKARERVAFWEELGLTHQEMVDEFRLEMMEKEYREMVGW